MLSPFATTTIALKDTAFVAAVVCANGVAASKAVTVANVCMDVAAKNTVAANVNANDTIAKTAAANGFIGKGMFGTGFRGSRDTKMRH